MHLDVALPSTTIDYIQLGKSVLRTESLAISHLEQTLDHHFSQACHLLLACRGKVILTGMGKSGHIAQKIAATLSSTGTPAFFLHPAEALHGDLGMIRSSDTLLALSYSGENPELLSILPILKRLQIPILSITGSKHSSLAQAANVHLTVSVEREACPLNLAPTASTTATLAMGDALAVALLEARGFTEEDFARAHPGGQLGRRLLLRVEDIMRRDSLIPTVPIGTPLKDALLEMSLKGLGMTAVLSTDEQSVLGIFTDGDLRRTLDKGLDLRTLTVDSVMTSPCTTVHPEMLAVQALRMMQDKELNGFLVVDQDQSLIGAFNMHDLLKHGVL